MGQYRIGQVTEMLGLGADTLRYYEKSGLIPRIARTASGIRLYGDQDISRLRFIRRAQQMNFTLAEIGDLLKMRENPHQARVQVRQLTADKLAEVESRLDDLNTLRKELRLLLTLCKTSEDGCPIIEGMDKKSGEKKASRSRK